MSRTRLISIESSFAAKMRDAPYIQVSIMLKCNFRKYDVKIQFPNITTQYTNRFYCNFYKNIVYMLHIMFLHRYLTLSIFSRPISLVV